MNKLTAILLIAATALLGACNKTTGDNAGGTAGSAGNAASSSK